MMSRTVSGIALSVALMSQITVAFAQDLCVPARTKDELSQAMEWAGRAGLVMVLISKGRERLIDGVSQRRLIVIPTEAASLASAMVGKSHSLLGQACGHPSTWGILRPGASSDLDCTP
jgi:hypothetical protein